MATTDIYTYLHTLSLHDALPISPVFVDQQSKLMSVRARTHAKSLLAVLSKQEGEKTVCSFIGVLQVQSGWAQSMGESGSLISMEQFAAAFSCVMLPFLRALLWRNQQTRSEEHTSELQSLMRIPYAVF